MVAGNCWLLPAGYWLCTGYWLLTAGLLGCWSAGGYFATGCYLLSAGCYLLSVDCLAVGCWVSAASYWVILVGSAVCVAIVCCVLTVGCWLLGVLILAAKACRLYDYLLLVAVCRLLISTATSCWSLVAEYTEQIYFRLCRVVAVLSVGSTFFHSRKNLVSRSLFHGTRLDSRAQGLK